MSPLTQSTTADLQTESFQTVHVLDGNFSIRVVEDMTEFMNLKEAWDGLLSNKKSHVPFLCHDWFRIWLKHFLKEDKLFILLLYKGERLIAIGPFIIKKEKYKGLINVKKIELIGNVHSTVRDFIYDESHFTLQKECISRFLIFFSDEFKQWDVIDLKSMPEESDCFQSLLSAIKEIGLKSREYFCYADWYLEGINSTGEEFLKKLPKGMRSENSRRERRLKEIGEVSTEIGTDGDNFTRHMDMYYVVRERSWKSPESDRDFHCEIRKMAADKGWLRCGFLLVNDNPIAAQIRIVSNGTVYFMEALHDSDFDKFGPGTLLRSILIRYFIDVEHITSIDQGRGDDAYKWYWTPERRERRGITIFNKTLRGQSLGFLMTKALPVVQSQPYLMTAKNKVLKYLGKGHE
jgi:CelD/BcsL family acetyltransferase involved in cellulose biosynthesis